MHAVEFVINDYVCGAVESVKKGIWALSNLWRITVSALQSVRINCLRYAICEEQLCLLGYCKEWVDCCWICDKWLCAVWNLWGITMHATLLCYTVTAVRKQWDNFVCSLFCYEECIGLDRKKIVAIWRGQVGRYLGPYWLGGGGGE